MFPPPVVTLLMIFSGIMGALVGSFLNVCIYRLPRSYLSIVTPRSHCPHCGIMIRWYDNLPIVSWLLLGGACRYCRSIIRFRYIFVEILTATLFLLCAHWILIAPDLLSPFAGLALPQRWLMLFFSFYFMGNLIVITYIDIDYRIIPDSLTYPGILIAPLFSALFPVLHQTSPAISDPHLTGFLASALGIVVGGGSLYLIGIIGKIIFRKEAMGFGDVKMMAMVGGFLGWDAALLIFFVACVAGTILGLASLVVTKDHYIPFGPYLAFGTVVIFFFKNQATNFIFNKWPQLLSNWLGMATGY